MLNYNNNGPNNGMNCENGFHVYCHMYIHFGNRTRGISHCGPKIRWSFTNHHPVSGGMNYKKPPQNQNCKQLSKSMGRKWVKRAISYNKSGIKVVLNDCRLHRSLCSSAGRIWCWMSVSASHTVPFLHTTKKLNIVQKQSLMKREPRSMLTVG